MVLGHSSDIFSCCVDCRLTPSWSGNANLQWGKERGQLIDCISVGTLSSHPPQSVPNRIGLRPPDFLESAMRLPPNNMGLTSTGQAPRSKMLINPVISFRSAEDVSRWLASSSRCWGRRPSGPPAEPDGKERIGAATSDSSTWYGIVVLVRAWQTSETIGVGVNWVFTSQDTEVLQVWCGRATLVTKNANSCTNIAILQFGGDSSQENVRAFTWGSVPSPRSYSLHRWLCGSTQGFHTSLHYIRQIVSSAGSFGLS